MISEEEAKVQRVSEGEPNTSELKTWRCTRCRDIANEPEKMTRAELLDHLDLMYV